MPNLRCRKVKPLQKSPINDRMAAVPRVRVKGGKENHYVFLRHELMFAVIHATYHLPLGRGLCADKNSSRGIAVGVGRRSHVVVERGERFDQRHRMSKIIGSRTR